jgi:fructose-specific phosphotransferase system IIC component
MTTFYTVVSWLVILGYWLLIAGVTLRILMKRRAVPSAMAWLLIIYILPLVGIIAISLSVSFISVNAAPSGPAPCGPPPRSGLTT